MGVSWSEDITYLVVVLCMSMPSFLIHLHNITYSYLLLQTNRTLYLDVDVETSQVDKVKEEKGG